MEKATVTADRQRTAPRGHCVQVRDYDGRDDDRYADGDDVLQKGTHPILARSL